LAELEVAARSARWGRAVSPDRVAEEPPSSQLGLELSPTWASLPAAATGVSRQFWRQMRSPRWFRTIGVVRVAPDQPKGC